VHLICSDDKILAFFTFVNVMLRDELTHSILESGPNPSENSDHNPIY